MKESEAAPPLSHTPFDPLEDSDDTRDRWKSYLRIVTVGHESLHSSESSLTTLNLVLELLAHEVGAGYGFISRYAHSRHADSSNTLRIIAVTWTEDLRHILTATSDPPPFEVSKGGLLMEPLVTGKLFVTNDPPSPFSARGLPPGHPPIGNYVGVPIRVGDDVIGVIGLANSTRGQWREDDLSLLIPLVSMIGSIVLLSELADRSPSQHEMSPYFHSAEFSPIVPFFRLHSSSSSSSNNSKTSSPSPVILLSHSLPAAATPTPPTLLLHTRSPGHLLLTNRSPPLFDSHHQASSSTASRTKSDIESLENAKGILPDLPLNLRSDLTSAFRMQSEPNGKGKSPSNTFKLTPSLTKISQDFLAQEIPAAKAAQASDTTVTTSEKKVRRRKAGSSRTKYRKRMEYMGRALVHVFESLSDGIVVFNEALAIITCNPACAAMLAFKDPVDLQAAFPRFDAILRPVGRFQSDEASPKIVTVPMDSPGGNVEDWTSDLKNLLSLTRTSSRRIRLEGMLNRNPMRSKDDTTPQQADVAASPLNSQKIATTFKELLKKSGDNEPIQVEDSLKSGNVPSEKPDVTSAQEPKSSPVPLVVSKDNLSPFCPVDMSITSFTYEGETYFSAVIRDVTQDKVYREKDTLLAFLSHEIRNPVQAITLGCQLLLQNSRSSTTTTIAKDLYLAADLLHSVVTDTIDYVQISTHNFQAKMEVCSY
jgi:PAS domain-containing protein